MEMEIKNVYYQISNQRSQDNGPFLKKYLQHFFCLYYKQ